MAITWLMEPVGTNDQTDIFDELDWEHAKFTEFYEMNFLTRIPTASEQNLYNQLQKISIFLWGVSLDLRSSEYLPHIRTLNLGIAEVEWDDSLNKQERIDALLFVCDIFLIAIWQKKKPTFSATPQKVRSVLERQNDIPERR